MNKEDFEDFFQNSGNCCKGSESIERIKIITPF